MSATNDRKVVINKRQKGLSREALGELSQTELIDKIVQLEAYNFQLRNLLHKKLTEHDRSNAEYAELLGKETAATATAPKETTTHSGKVKKQRKFDWSIAHQRHVLLKLTYFGWDYQGFACQEDSNDTIESHLFRALTRTCLIESRATSNYHRCGRTDKEVSAFCQVISIDLRSKHTPDTQLEPASLSSEIDYCGLLNRVLPKNIQCVAWMPLRSPVYSARFDCTSRSYRYYFPKGDLDIEAMREACKLLVGHSDFRNFCKMDVHNGVTKFIRNLQAARVEPCVEMLNNSGYDMYYLEIQANAFLWHQIRCIMAVLLLVGQRRELPRIVSDLLDVETNPCKPQYTPALGLPLNLFHCNFRDTTTRKLNLPADGAEDDEAMDTSAMDVESSESSAEEKDITSWIYNEENLEKLIENIQCEWTEFSVKSTMIRNVLQQLEHLLEKNYHIKERVTAQVILLQDSVKPREYQPLLERKRCESLENRIEHFVKKQRLIVKDES
ncbi:tRNA pseudouridine(38/39) synthase [Drosophila pseudoobscura]|uniref:tRNA pseudouridine(38/39) synthase n=1 Tax=Drosophila pseudoobscura pseudoobscura TaxID=46245 RepID=A0A6I8UWS1_DROPS|nr:tRNA pseudouridine(38/39) synthase [Drosophila pseudoobscura]